VLVIQVAHAGDLLPRGGLDPANEMGTGSESVGGLVNHPRLYFSASDIPALQARMTQPPTNVLWAGIHRTAVASSSVPSSAASSGAAWTVLGDLRYTSFDYAMTGNEAMGKKGKAWLLKVCAWPSWTDPASVRAKHLVNYDTGKIALGVAEAYDWLYPLLTDRERADIRKAIIEKALKPAYTDYTNGMYDADARTNRAPQGWGGIGVAGLAILGDDPGNTDVERYLTACNAVVKEYLDTFDSEGGWGEGVSYQAYSLADGSGALYYMEALRRVKGEDLYEHPKFKKAMNFPLYLLPPDRRAGTDGFGDAAFDTGYSMAAIARFAAAYSSGYAAWYYNHGPLYPVDDMATFLWYDARVPETNPEGSLPTGKLFPDIGWAVQRTGWDTTDALLAFRSGPVYPGHNRAEQNSFMFDAKGKRLIIEPGISRKEYSDPNYYSYYKAAVSQNTILLNGNAHSQDEIELDNAFQPAGAITDFVSTDFYGSVTGDAARVYRGKLSRFTRQIVFVKPDYLTVYDDLASSAGSLEFDSLLHTLGTNTIKVKADTVLITQQEVTLNVKVLKPTSFLSSVKRGQPVLIQNTEYPTSYLLLRPRAKLASTQFLMVLYPLGKGETLPPISGISAGNVDGVRVERGQRTDTIPFNPGGTPFSTAGITSDAASCYLSVQRNSMTEFAVHGGKMLEFRGENLYTSSQPTTAALQYHGDRITGVITAGSPVEVSLGSPQPASLTVDGSTHPALSQSSQGVISFSLEKGEHTIELVTMG